MKSAIQALYYGKFAQIEKLKPTERQLKNLDIVMECDEKLTALLKDDNEALAIYGQFKRAMEENVCEESLTFYKEGFRNGFQIALDGLDEDEQ